MNPFKCSLISLPGCRLIGSLTILVRCFSPSRIIILFGKDIVEAKIPLHRYILSPEFLTRFFGLWLWWLNWVLFWGQTLFYRPLEFINRQFHALSVFAFQLHGTWVIVFFVLKCSYMWQWFWFDYVDSFAMNQVNYNIANFLIAFENDGGWLLQIKL